jgi:hypothetical protein
MKVKKFCEMIENCYTLEMKSLFSTSRSETRSSTLAPEEISQLRWRRARYLIATTLLVAVTGMVWNDVKPAVDAKISKMPSMFQSILRPSN